MQPVQTFRPTQISRPFRFGSAAHCLWRNASQRTTRRERALLTVLVVLLVVALFAPALVVAAVLDFADARTLGGVPNALNVLSNLPFAVIGLAGLWRLRWLDGHAERMDAWRDTQPLALAVHGESTGREPPARTLDCAWLFFVGLLTTAAGSTFFHLWPDAVSLAADRMGMAVAFAGLLGMAVCERISQRAGWPTACVVLASGLIAAAMAVDGGNVLPWALVQFGGIVIVVVLALLRPVHGALRLRLAVVIALYAVAKGCEMADASLFHLTGDWLSGHTLKHLAAALAALPVLGALTGAGRDLLRHNPDAVQGGAADRAAA